MKDCDVCLALKVIRHKLFGDFQSLPLPTYWWKDWSIDFVIGLPISINWKNETYNSMLMIVECIIRMVYYEPVKVLIDTQSLVEVIINTVIRYQGLSNSITSNQELVFTSKFWFFLCYFLDIKQRLSTTSYLQINSQTKT